MSSTEEIIEKLQVDFIKKYPDSNLSNSMYLDIQEIKQALCLCETELETSLNHLKNHTLEEDSEGMKLSLERVKLFKSTHSELSAWQRGLKEAIAVERRRNQKR